MIDTIFACIILTRIIISPCEKCVKIMPVKEAEGVCVYKISFCRTAQQKKHTLAGVRFQQEDYWRGASESSASH